MRVHLYLFILFAGILSCNTVNEKKREIDGSYRGVLSLNNAELPFIFTLKTDEEGIISGELVNGEERIQLDDIIRSQDSLYIPMHIFDAGLEALITKKGLEGKFIRYFEEDYTIPFRAQKDITKRFEPREEEATVDFSGKWEVTLNRPDKTSRLIGIFNQSGNAISGSFMSATGDFRFLDGQVFGNKMEMSAFDGDNIYLFTAEMDESGHISGTHWSGKTVIAEWSGFRNENAELADANTLTYLKEGYDRINFRFPDLNGNMVSLSDEKYQDKVVLLQIFGTWCPICMD